MSTSGRRTQNVPIPTRRPERRPEPVTSRQPENSRAVEAVKAEQGATSDEGYLESKDPTPTFAGFEDERYQQHDERIEELVQQFNADKAGFIGATPEQVAEMGDVDPAMIKSWLIQETGGGDKRSRAAWDKDPAQVNVPGDWGHRTKSPKADEQMGLSRPSRRNTGTTDGNMKASMVWLARKGFSRSGKAPKDLEGGQSFGGWEKALQNYNGRGEKRSNGKRYRENYAERILQRAGNSEEHAPIQLPK